MQSAVVPVPEIDTTVACQSSKETQTAVVWSCLPFITSGQNHLAKHSERGKKTRQTEEDNIREWTGLEFAKSQRAVENRKERKKWRKLVVKSAVVPQRPPRLRAKCRKGEFNSCSEISFPSRLSLRELESKGKIITIPPPTSFFLSFGVGYHAVSPIILPTKTESLLYCLLQAGKVVLH